MEAAEACYRLSSASFGQHRRGRPKKRIFETSYRAPATKIALFLEILLASEEVSAWNKENPFQLLTHSEES